MAHTPATQGRLSRKAVQDYWVKALLIKDEKQENVMLLYRCDEASQLEVWLG